MANDENKTTRLYLKTYLQMLHNAVGTQMFRNFYIVQSDGTEFDAMDDGSDSCAFFVSSVLTLFQKLSSVHGTIVATKQDLEDSNWQLVDTGNMAAGDVLVWEAQVFDDEPQEHIGFYVGTGRAISTSWTEKRVVEHDASFNGDRAIIQVYHCQNWEQ